MSRSSEDFAEVKGTVGVSRKPASVDTQKIFDRSQDEWVPRDENESELFYHGDL